LSSVLNSILSLGLGSGPPGTDGAFGLDRPRLLLLFVPLLFFAALRMIRDRKYARLMASFALMYRLSRFLFWVFCASLIFALAGPHWGLRRVSEYRWGLDVTLALDLSRSMEVRDLGRSRLERAVLLCRELAEQPGFRLGLAFGRGRGNLAIPLTDDRPVIMSLLESLDETVYTGAGTNLESLVDAACSAFLDDSPGRRLIVLLSDGEAHAGSLGSAARRARGLDIGIAAVGLGTTAGGPVPAANAGGFGNVTGTGEIAGTGNAAESVEAADSADSAAESPLSPLSRLRREALEEAAALTGGVYIDGADPLAGSQLMSYIESLASEREGSSWRRENRPRWRFFLCVALAALALSKLCMRRFAPRASRPLVLVLLLPLVPLIQSCSPAAGKLLVMEGNFYHSQGRYDEAIEVYMRALEYPETLPYAEYGLGTVYASLEERSAALGRYGAALEAYGALPAGEAEELGYRVNYNLGVVLFWEGDFEGAAGAFRKALEIDGSRVEAKRNLEIALLSFSREGNPGDGGEAPREEEGDDPRLDALFRYLNLKEQNQWKSREWAEEPSPAGPDY
jgi:Ca-activated chloride channel family protein